MNCRSGLFILLFSSLMVCIAACVPPIGSLNGSGNSDTLMTSPRRLVYNINDLFSRDEDLLVFASYQGLIKSIPVDLVDISVIEDPYSPDQSAKKIPPSSGTDPYVFTKTGRSVIVVTYNKMSDRYSVEVQDPYGLEDTSGGDNNGGGIIVEWL